MYAIYGNIYHQYTPNVSIYTIHGSYGYWNWKFPRHPCKIRSWCNLAMLPLSGRACVQCGDLSASGGQHCLTILNWTYLAMNQYLLIPFLVGWTSILTQLFWCELQGYNVLTLPYVNIMILTWCIWYVYVHICIYIYYYVWTYDILYVYYIFNVICVTVSLCIWIWYINKEHVYIHPHLVPIFIIFIPTVRSQAHCFARTRQRSVAAFVVEHWRRPSGAWYCLVLLHKPHDTTCLVGKAGKTR